TRAASLRPSAAGRAARAAAGLSHTTTRGASMATAVTTPDRLVLADLVPGSLARDAALIVGGACLTGLAAQVSIHTPLTPVPFTLQTFAVLLTGAVLGPVRGVLSMLLYLLAGVVGGPWDGRSPPAWGGPAFG